VPDNTAFTWISAIKVLNPVWGRFDDEILLIVGNFFDPPVKHRKLPRQFQELFFGRQSENRDLSCSITSMEQVNTFGLTIKGRLSFGDNIFVKWLLDDCY